MVTLKTHPFTDAPARSILTVFLAVPIITAIVALCLSPDSANWLLAERGPIERQSPILWIILGVFALGLFGVRTLTGSAAAILAFGAAAREADFHIAFTGYSVLKIPFYYHSDQPIETRLIAGTIVLLIALSAILLAWRAWKQFRKHSLKALPSWAWITLMALAALIISKGFDRSQAILEDTFHFEMHDSLALSIRAIEESTEMLLPLTFAAAMLCLVYNETRRSTATLDPNQQGTPS